MLQRIQVCFLSLFILMILGFFVPINGQINILPEKPEGLTPCANLGYGYYIDKNLIPENTSITWSIIDNSGGYNPSGMLQISQGMNLTSVVALWSGQSETVTLIANCLKQVTGTIYIEGHWGVNGEWVDGHYEEIIVNEFEASASLVIHPLKIPTITLLGSSRLFDCPNTKTDLNAATNIMKSVQNGYWKGIGIEEGRYFNPSGLKVGIYEVSYWENGKPAIDPCGNGNNKLLIGVNNISDMLILEPSPNISIPLNTAYLWEGPGVVGTMNNFKFEATAEGTYELLLKDPINYYIKGKKTIIIKAKQPTSPSSVNMVKTSTVLKEGITNPNDVNPLSVLSGEVAIQRTYSDGLGRPIQNIQQQASPLQNDIVSFSVYDPLGRNSLQYLPFTQGNDGLLKNNVLASQQQFYTSAPEITHSGFAYGKVEYENSALQRVSASYSPGETHVVAGIKIVQNQSVNTSDYVRRLQAQHTRLPKQSDMAGLSANLNLPTYDGNTKLFRATQQIELTDNFTTPDAVSEDIVFEIVDFNNTYQDSGFSDNRYYPAGELMVTETTSEDGYRKRSYANKSGQLVLSEAQSDESGNNFLQTYYCYDDFGQLRYTFPPKAVELLKANNWQIDNDILKLIFYDDFDEKGRLVSSKVADKGRIYTVYDKMGRVVLIQDANQRTKNEWTFSKYDFYGRAVQTGIYKTTASQSALQSASNQNQQLYEVRNTSAEFQYYSNTAFPILNTAADEIETTNYYDDYNFDNQGQADAVYNTDYNQFFTGSIPTPVYGDKIKGNLTASNTRLDNPDGSFKQWLGKTIFYDDKGRIIQTQSQNHLGGIDITTIQYDYSGKVLSSYLQHETTQSSINVKIGVKERFEYDHVGRLLKSFQLVKHNDPYITDLPEEKISEIRYNELGQVIWKKLGNDDLQTVDFSYSIRGQLVKVNDIATIGTGSETDLFAYTLMYENHPNPLLARFDGKISSMLWKSSLDNVQRGYEYAYDPLGRLVNATYITTSQNTAENFSEGGLSYDANGNILTLNRKGMVTGNVFGDVDQLVYKYDGNKLLSVTDAKNTVGIAGDFQDNNKAGNDYAYDANGNLSIDRNKGIDAIQYNAMDMPVQIVLSEGRRVEHLYDREGNKLKTLVYESGTKIRETDYVGIFTYEKNELSFMQTTEGRYLFKIPNAPAQGRKRGYEYYINDHMGNLRVSFRKGDTYTYTTGVEPTETTQNQTDFATFFALATLEQQRTGTSSAKVQNQSVLIKKLEVGKGDRISFSLWTMPENPQETNNQSNNLSLNVSAMPTSNTGNEGQAGTGIENIVVGIGYAPQNNNSSNPAGADTQIRLVFYNRDNQLVGEEVKQIADLQGWQSNNLVAKAPQGGFVEIHLENTSQNPVYADDIVITHEEHLISQENHYYPFGMNLVGIGKEGDNRWQYNAMTEKNTDFGMDWYETPFRRYDPQIGRFHQVDPLAAKYPSVTPYNFALNNPVSQNDPTGCECYWVNGECVTLLEEVEVEGKRWTSLDELLYNHALAVSQERRIAEEERRRADERKAEEERNAPRNRFGAGWNSTNSSIRYAVEKYAKEKERESERLNNPDVEELSLGVSGALLGGFGFGFKVARFNTGLDKGKYSMYFYFEGIIGFGGGIGLGYTRSYYLPKIKDFKTDALTGVSSSYFGNLGFFGFDQSYTKKGNSWSFRPWDTKKDMDNNQIIWRSGSSSMDILTNYNSKDILAPLRSVEMGNFGGGWKATKTWQMFEF